MNDAGSKLRSKMYSKVRVAKLVGSMTDYDGWMVSQRNPRVGDTGTLIDVLDAPDLPSKFVVEKSDENGITIWLADFFQEELDLID